MNTIGRTLNLFPEVKWDRWAGDEKETVSVFGWVEKEGTERCDFIHLMIDAKEGPWLIQTSSAKHSAEFSKRLGFRHSNCKRVEDSFRVETAITLTT